MRRLALAAVAAALGAGCSGRALPIATEADAARVQVAKAELDQGRGLLISHCSGCHLTPAPDDHPAAAWPAEVAEMRERSNLTPAQAETITRYLVAFAR
ncbi:MAG: hypothetical protein R3B06_24865 [Kofleriaceae bacterium]